MLGLIGQGSAWGQSPASPGTSLPSIEGPLQRINGNSVRLRELTGQAGTVVLFWSNRCPWTAKYRGRIESLVAAFEGKGIRFVLVNANDASRSAQESLEKSRSRAEGEGYPGTYVRNPDASLAKALGATRTPHAYLFNSQDRLVYVGAIDDSPGNPDQVENPYLRSAIEAVLSDRTPTPSQTKAFGCTLKYP